MPLIDITYFNASNFIPQLSLTYNMQRLASFINEREPEYLRNALGENLAAAFIAGISVPEVNIEQRWKDLRDGKDFSVGEYTMRWNGFLNPQKYSPIANYIFYWWMREAASFSTGSGQVLPSVENGLRTAGADKMVRQWNDMVHMTIRVTIFLQANKASYPEYQQRRCLTDVDVFNVINAKNI